MLGQILATIAFIIGSPFFLDILVPLIFKKSAKKLMRDIDKWATIRYKKIYSLTLTDHSIHEYKNYSENAVKKFLPKLAVIFIPLFFMYHIILLGINISDFFFGTTLLQGSFIPYFLWGILIILIPISLIGMIFMYGNNLAHNYENPIEYFKGKWIAIVISLLGMSLLLFGSTGVLMIGIKVSGTVVSVFLKFLLLSGFIIVLIILANMYESTARKVIKFFVDEHDVIFFGWSDDLSQMKIRFSFRIFLFEIIGFVYVTFLIIALLFFQLFIVIPTKYFLGVISKNSSKNILAFIGFVLGIVAIYVL